MNWYKKIIVQSEEPLEEYSNYTDIGHFKQKEDEDTQNIVLWMSDLNGNNFHKVKLEGSNDSYDHHGLSYDTNLNRERGVLQGRYDQFKNIVSICYDPRIITMRYLPNRIINRLQQEFGKNVTIIDYTNGKK